MAKCTQLFQISGVTTENILLSDDLFRRKGDGFSPFSQLDLVVLTGFSIRSRSDI